MKTKKNKRIIVFIIAAILFGITKWVLIPIGDGLEEIGQAYVVIMSLFELISLVIASECFLLIMINLVKTVSHRGNTILTILSSLIKYSAALIILCGGMRILGVDVSAIAATVGLLALIVGFGAETLIEDVITGVFLIFENQYNVGDIIEVDGFRGCVHSIGIRTTSIADKGGNIKIINNSQMRHVVNCSDDNSVAVSDIAIPYETDLEAFETKLDEICKVITEKNTAVFLEPLQYVGVQELAESGIVLRFIVGVDEKDIYKARRILNHDLLIEFRKRGITCPYNRMDVHSV